MQKIHTEENERKEFVNRRRRIRNYELRRKQRELGHCESKSPRDRSSVQEEESRTDSMINQKFAFTGNQEQVKLIQKNVRGWLLRRQYHDTKFAVKILQSRKLFFHSDFKELLTKIKDQ